jgi:predicted P-loop ATPase
MQQNLESYYPKEIATILATDDMTEKNGAILRNYFMNPDRFDQQKRTIVFSVPSRTGTSFFRSETPLFAIAKHFPEKFNLVYADNNLNAKHLEIADLIVAHRAGHLHEWMHSVVKAWPKNKKRAVICHNVDDHS